MDSLNLKVVEVKGKSRGALNKALLELSTCDADFSGENGIDYLWKEARRYSSNAAYVLKKELKEETDHKTIIEKFIKRWIENDSYYLQYDLDVKYDKNGNAKVIALALTY
jgi:hypothetical protein